jgi:hypothetical protein
MGENDFFERAEVLGVFLGGEVFADAVGGPGFADDAEDLL